MDELVLKASDDHVGRLSREGDPVRAVVELIWNSIDAESTTVSVDFERNETGGISTVTVTDDGHGISRDEVSSTFGQIGDSWKKRSRRSKNGKRGLHGELGEGRLRAFALGSRVSWDSTSRDGADELHSILIQGDRGRRHVFPWEARPANRSDTGTKFTARNDTQRSLASLDSKVTTATLLSHFAPILLNDPGLSVTYDGTDLDPVEDMVGDTTREIKFGGLNDDQYTAQLRIIEWRSGAHRAIYFGKDAEHFVYEEPGKLTERQFVFSAYLTWPLLSDDVVAVLPLGDLAQEPASNLSNAVRKAIGKHFADRRLVKRREQVKRWQDQGVYPYTGAADTETERAERAVFDVLSGALSSQISSKKQDAKLTLVLLRDALQSDPDKLTTIVHEVVALNDSDRTTLTQLLKETTLPSVIRSANLVASRHKFLHGLEHLLFDPTDSKDVGERDHLHRLLERELWIFGESYHLMSSERGLTDMLRTHLRLEGLPSSGISPVKRWDGKGGRTDLHLAATFKQHDRIHHLIVELKAPGITLGRKELDQVEDYAETVLNNPAFSSAKSTWEFILVGTDFGSKVETRIGENVGDGQFVASPQKPGRPTVRAYVRKWRDVIDENKQRLKFITEALEHDPTVSEGLGHIREQYRDLLPISLTSEDEADDPYESESSE